MKKFLAFLMVLVMLVSGAAMAEQQSYTASADGMGGPVEVTVTFEDGKIASVTVGSNSETPGVSDRALAEIPQAIVENQSVAVDAISGATLSSDAVINAVKACIEMAGLNVEDFSAAVENVASGEKVEKSADVVIVGAGGAGLAAAITANENGASVIVIEKMGSAGGNTILSGGLYNCVDPTRQQRSNVEDSVEKHTQQTLEGGDNVANPELVKILCENATDGLLWLESMGMMFNEDVTTATGALWPRSHQAVRPNGTGFIETYLNKLSGTDVEILYDVKADEILMNDGRAVGVHAVGTDGTEYTFNAGRGVILASGGYGSNVEMRQKYNTQWPTLDESVVSSNSVGATGDGLVMAEAVGANLVGMDYIQLHPLGNPKTGNFVGVVRGDVESYIQVNLEGKRYIAEDARRDELCKAALEQPSGLMWQITDSNSASNATPESSVAKGYAVKADTIEELAQAMGVDEANLVAAIKEYNDAVDTGNDPLGRVILTKKVEVAPFYAVLRAVTVHHTMGGVEINTETQVIDTDGNVIPGLYAAGEVTGGIHGSNRLGGNALADTVVFGRIAGTNASAE